jgi:hypothetical protein
MHDPIEHMVDYFKTDLSVSIQDYSLLILYFNFENWIIINTVSLYIFLFVFIRFLFIFMSEPISDTNSR